MAAASRPQASDQGPAEVGRLGEAGLGEGGAPAVAAEADGLEVLGAGDVGDAAAAGAGEVVGREARALRVVGDEAEAVVVGAVREDEEGGQVAEGHADAGAAVGAAGGEDQAVDALAHQLLDVLALAGGIVGGVAHEDADAAVGELALEALHDRQGEAAEAVVGDEADGEALAAEQRLREVVRAEAELGRDADDAGAGLLAEGAGVVQRLRDGADADAGRLGDVADRLAAAADGRRPRSFHRAAEEAGDVVALQQQVDQHAGDDRDDDAGLQRAPVDGAELRRCGRPVSMTGTV